MFNQIGAIFLRVLISLAVAFAAAPGIAGSRYALRMDGLDYSFCAYVIENQLSHVDGVKSIATDIGKGEVVIEMVDGKALDTTAAERAVTGFIPLENDFPSDDLEGQIEVSSSTTITSATTRT